MGGRRNGQRFDVRADVSRLGRACAHRELPCRAWPAAALPAYAGGGVLDRLKRLLVPDYRPELHISWSALVGSAVSAHWP